MPTRAFPRFAQAALLEALADSPVVLLQGPRQCGKTTLAQRVGAAAGRVYLTFDDDVLQQAATADPIGFVADLPPIVTLDEAQRVPSLFTALKQRIDRDRRPGSVLLTGSANLLRIPALSDSLAGRLAVQRLFPLAQCELRGRAASFLDHLFDGTFAPHVGPRLGADLAERIAGGGFPAALARATARRRGSWYRDYVSTLVQRDVQAIARISALDAIPRLLTLAAGQSGRLLNATALAAPFQLSRPTVRDYITILEQVFLIDLLPPWHDNRLSRLVKTPKLHVTDTGIATALLGLAAADLQADRGLLGQFAETFVVQELRRLASWHTTDLTFSHYRDKDGVEVDLVVEWGVRHVAGIEVKAGATVTTADLRGLRRLQDVTGARFRCGVVLYDGERTVRFGERLFAVPVRALWEG